MSCCQPTTYHAYSPALGKLDAPKRNHYYFSKMMDVLQFETEQSYVNDKRWLLNRLSLGTGVLCGLGVHGENNVLCVDPGVATDTFGHEIIVPGRFCIDPWLLPDACGKPLRALSKEKRHEVTLCLGYHECLADHAPVLVTDCRAEQLCEAGSVVESFKLWVREGWPKPAPGLCEALNGETATGGYEVVATIDVGGRPVGVAVAADGKRALVANADTKPTLQVVDVATNTVVHTIAGAVQAPIGGVSIAPDGGPIFVTHAGGVVVVKMDSATPTATPLLEEVAYGACAASHGGARLYAINTKKKIVEVIDVATGKAKPLKTGKAPSDLAVSSDSATLFVADTSTDAVLGVDTTTNDVKWEKPTDKDCQSLAATGAAATIVAWSAAQDAARRFDSVGSSNDVTFAADVSDSAFTTDGARYYATHAAKGNGPDQVVVMNAADGKEIARLPVGKAPAGVAIVPNRLRAYIANADGGSVTVVDVASLRERLCRAMLGPCPDPEKEPCVELATVELLPDGTIGKVDVCTHRVRLLSNEALLELILCLADKMEACCGGHAPLPPSDSPPVVEPLKVTEVEFIRMNGALLGNMPTPAQAFMFKAGSNVDRVRLTFNRAVDPATIVTGGLQDDPKKFSLLVSADWSTAPMDAVGGKVQFDTPNSATWVIGPEPRTIQKGDYKLILFGNPDATALRPRAAAADGGVLDGEPLGFPSGDGTDGGNFTIKFTAQ